MAKFHAPKGGNPFRALCGVAIHPTTSRTADACRRCAKIKDTNDAMAAHAAQVVQRINAEMSAKAEWQKLIEADMAGQLTREQWHCLHAADDNADLTAHEQGFELQSDRWYSVALSGYEMLLESGDNAIYNDRDEQAELPQLTDVVWARNAWDPNTLEIGPAAYVLEVFEYDCGDWLRVAACYDLDTIKALANDYDLLPALITRYGNVFTPGDHRVTYFGNSIEL